MRNGEKKFVMKLHFIAVINIAAAAVIVFAFGNWKINKLR
jgi:hypothetical protein